MSMMSELARRKKIRDSIVKNEFDISCFGITTNTIRKYDLIYMMYTALMGSRTEYYMYPLSSLGEEIVSDVYFIDDQKQNTWAHTKIEASEDHTAVKRINQLYGGSKIVCGWSHGHPASFTISSSEDHGNNVDVLTQIPYHVKRISTSMTLPVTFEDNGDFILLKDSFSNLEYGIRKDMLSTESIELLLNVSEVKKSIHQDIPYGISLIYVGYPTDSLDNKFYCEVFWALNPGKDEPLKVARKQIKLFEEKSITEPMLRKEDVLIDIASKLRRELSYIDVIKIPGIDHEYVQRKMGINYPLPVKVDPDMTREILYLERALKQYGSKPSILDKILKYFKGGKNGS